MTTQGSNLPPRRTLMVGGLAGLGILAVCLCLAAFAGIGAYFFINRSATASQPTVEYILDASPRMQQPTEGGTRLSVAQAVLAEIVRPADKGVTAGLRVFGTGAVAGGCKDTSLLVPLAQANQNKIAESILAVDASTQADAALAEAMVAAIRDIAKTKGPHTLVVVTGGADSCNAQAAALIKQEAEKSGIKLQEFVIGFEVDAQDIQAIKSVVEATSGGAYLNAPDGGTLRNILRAIQTYIDHPTTTSIASVMAAATPGAAPASNAPPATSSAGNETPEAQGQTACDHPYLPLRKGASWQYSGTGDLSYTWEVQSVSGDMNNATAVVVIKFQEGSVTYNWTCTAEGITYFQTANISGFGNDISAEINVTQQSGTSLLGVGNLKPGATWNSAYTMTYSIKAEGTAIDVTTAVSEAHTAGSAQSLSLGAGAFEVIPVTSNGTYSTSSSFGGGGASFSSTSTIYFAKGVGIVRIESNSSGTSSTTE